MSSDSLRTAGIVLVLFPTVVFGGVTLLRLVLGRDPGYEDNPLRQRLWRAGHAHAGVLLVLSLAVLALVDQADLGSGWKQLVRSAVPASAVFVPAAFFLSVARPSATRPNALIHLAWVGALALVVGLATLGVGLLRAA